MLHRDIVEMKVRLTATGPLLLGSGLPIGNVRVSESFVAGSVWRGAIARVVLERLGSRSYSGRPTTDSPLPPAFTDLFSGQSPARFGFLYPLIGERKDCIAWTAAPLPLTARTCKRQPGFHQPKGHGVYDGLLNRLRETRPLGQCPACGERLERMRGFASAPAGQAAVDQEKLGTRSLVRVGLNRYTETAQDQMLYVQDVLEPGHEANGQPKALAFVGWWRGSAAQAEQLQTLLQTYGLPTENGGYHLRIGSARARGLGAVELHLSSPQPLVAVTLGAAIEERVTALTHQLTGGTGPTAHLYATLTLRAPLQLLDEWGVPTTQLTVPLLQAYAGTLPAGLQILTHSSVVEQEQMSGWSAAWGLPKPLAPALAAGSVVALRAPTNERQALLEFLTAVAQHGLGERRAEGLGDLVVCDPFHTEYDEQKAQQPKEAGA